VRQVYLLVQGHCRVVRKLAVVNGQDGLLALARAPYGLGTRQLLVTSDKVGPGLVFAKDGHAKAVVSDRRAVCLVLAEAMLARVSRQRSHDAAEQSPPAALQQNPGRQHPMLLLPDSAVFACYNQTQTWERFRRAVLDKVLAAQAAPTPHQFPATLRLTARGSVKADSEGQCRGRQRGAV